MIGGIVRLYMMRWRWRRRGVLRVGLSMIVMRRRWRRVVRIGLSMILMRRRWVMRVGLSMIMMRRWMVIVMVGIIMRRRGRWGMVMVRVSVMIRKVMRSTWSQSMEIRTMNFPKKS